MGTRYHDQYPCPKGYYRNATQGVRINDCDPCPGGWYCGSQGLAVPQDECDPGYYCVRAAWRSNPEDFSNYTQGDCLCPKNITGGKCEPGDYCPRGSQQPIPCTQGHYCELPGLSAVTGKCDERYFCDRRSSTKTPTDGTTGNICPAGRYCPVGTTKEQPRCPPGTFSNRTGLSQISECTPCTQGFYCQQPGLTTPTGPCAEGFYCPAGQNSSTPFACEPGHYCREGSFNMTICPSGTYQDESGQGSCKECVAGYYCNINDGPLTNYTQYPCPGGYFCPNGTKWSTQYGCPTGSYNPYTKLEREEQCTKCDAGKYCASVGQKVVTGPCDAGFWCIKGSSTKTPLDGVTGSACITGHFCPQGTPMPLPCRLGSWSNSTGLKEISECQDCPGGQYCNGTGLAEPSGPCSARFYCSQNSSTPTPDDNGVTGAPCPIKTYCPEGTAVPIPCAHGTYMTNTGADACWPCTPGHYCISGGDPEKCPAGYYCPEGTGIVWQPCPTGTFSNTIGLSNETECTQCIGGNYCSIINSTAVSGQCQAGYYCTSGSDSDTPGVSSKGISGECPAGHYCPSATANPVGCPMGTYSNKTRLQSDTECTKCSFGHYCGESGLIEPSGLCWAGFYCLRGARSPNNPTLDSTSGPCPAGYYCLNGTSYPLGCPSGTYNPNTGEDSCQTCPAGYHCPENSTDYSGTPCPPGHYCPIGTKIPTEYPCPIGHFNDANGKAAKDDCKPCSPGKYCHTTGKDV